MYVHLSMLIFPSKSLLLKPAIDKKWKAIVSLLLCVGVATVSAAQDYWQQQVDYSIETSLNDVEHTLEGFEKILYANHSPDTLAYIWFHLWPNAYKNDRTAFSEQLLLQDRADFYFSSQEERGYINRLNFQVNGNTARVEDHPQYIDVVKLVLPQPLLPGQAATITTPFHVKLPQNFSRGGHVGQSYQITQWYPKPAVYDRRGWHEMPYLDQGEFFSEFGKYQVTITTPAGYVVAATGERQNTPSVSPAAGSTQTLTYLQDKVHDFAWFADKRFVVLEDTLRLPSGRVIHAASYYLGDDAKYWKNSLRSIKEAVRSRSAWLGEYPYNTVSVVEAQMGVSGGMEYPTIACISPTHPETDLDLTIAHEVTHNWLYGILASNERRYPWMDEGMNTFYDLRYLKIKYPGGARMMDSSTTKNFLSRQAATLLRSATAIKKDQPINTGAENFSSENYPLIAYYKAGMWMKKLEQKLGQTVFDSCMHAYYARWQFRHPYPEDFKAVLESVSAVKLDTLFKELETKGNLEDKGRALVLKPPVLYRTDYDHQNPIIVSPAAGFNLYDGLMIGGVASNFRLPFERFQFLASPLFATRSRRLGGMARAQYNWYPDKAVYKVNAGIAASFFSISEYKPEKEQKLFLGVRKVAPFVRATFHEDPLSKQERFVQFKSFLISEDQLDFRQVIGPRDTQNIVSKTTSGYVVNQVKVVVNNSRVLYPYSGELQLEQGRGFVRTVFTGKYFFNYASQEGGLSLRFFAGKFFYTGRQTTLKEFQTDRYHLNLTGAGGEEDYTYSNYFIGRNKFEGFASQQIMIRDGGFKVRTDLLSSKVGKTDNWLMAFNSSALVPKKINPLQRLPVGIPLRVFADVGTYAQAWDRNANLSRFVFDAGLQFSLFKETVNIYLPLVYSRVYRDYFKSTLGKNRFWKTISFSLDIQNLNWSTLNRAFPF